MTFFNQCYVTTWEINFTFLKRFVLTAQSQGIVLMLECWFISLLFCRDFYVLFVLFTASTAFEGRNHRLLTTNYFIFKEPNLKGRSPQQGHTDTSLCITFTPSVSNHNSQVRYSSGNKNYIALFTPTIFFFSLSQYIFCSVGLF